MTTRNKIHTSIALLSGFGLLLSGYLSYVNLWGPGCSQGFLSNIVSCGGPQKVLIFGLPTCIYGFFMYLAVFVTNLLAASTASVRHYFLTLAGLGIAGTLFSGGLTIYELFVLKLTFTTLPACVYGFVLYLGILVTAWKGLIAASKDKQVA